MNSLLFATTSDNLPLDTLRLQVAAISPLGPGRPKRPTSRWTSGEQDDSGQPRQQQPQRVAATATAASRRQTTAELANCKLTAVATVASNCRPNCWLFERCSVGVDAERDVHSKRLFFLPPATLALLGQQLFLIRPANPPLYFRTAKLADAAAHSIRIACDLPGGGGTVSELQNAAAAPCKASAKRRQSGLQSCRQSRRSLHILARGLPRRPTDTKRVVRLINWLGSRTFLPSFICLASKYFADYLSFSFRLFLVSPPPWSDTSSHSLHRSLLALSSSPRRSQEHSGYMPDAFGIPLV